MDWRKYIYAFVIASAIFATAIVTSNYFSQKKITEIQNIESRIAVDILSSETQFSLLSELSCRDIGNSFLSKEMANLGDKLSYAEGSRGSDDLEVINLKKYYSLLQIKDYLLMQKVKERCGTKTLSIIYFYSNIQGKCDDCSKEGFVLTKLKQDYPELRVYSFDYNLDLSALKALTSVYSVEDNMPAILVNDKVYYGFKSVEAIKNIIPDLKKIDLQKQQENKLEESTKPKSATSTE